MSKLNLSLFLNAYRDATVTNNPSMNNFRWNQDIQGIDVSEPTSKEPTLQPGQSLTLFSGTVSTSSDATTTWDLALKAGSTNLYRITHSGGTAPLFRTPRAEGSDATTEVTVTKNAKLMILTSTGGTPFNLIAGGAVVGDEARIGTAFNAANRGKFKILALTATSLTVENEVGTAEWPIKLGSSFATEVDIYSESGVKIADHVDILAGFSSVSFGTFDITDISHDFIEIFSNESLPAESDVPNNPDAFLIYRDAKQFLYIESDRTLDIKINGSVVTNEIIPMTAGVNKTPGIFMSSASIKSAEITNTSQKTAQIFYITAE